MVWIQNHLIPEGMYFGKAGNGRPNEEDRRAFKEVTRFLIARNHLDQRIFEKTDDRTRYLMGH